MLCFFLAGALTGAGVGLLLAPQPGRDMRAAMRRKLRETDGSARAMRDRFLRRGEEIRDEAARRMEATGATPAGIGSDALT